MYSVADVSRLLLDQPLRDVCCVLIKAVVAEASTPEHACEAGEGSPPTPVEHAQQAKPHLRSVQLSTACTVPVPTPAVEVARGVAERSTDGHACARIENVHALRPFLKVCLLLCSDGKLDDVALNSSCLLRVIFRFFTERI